MALDSDLLQRPNALARLVESVVQQVLEVQVGEQLGAEWVSFVWRSVLLRTPRSEETSLSLREGFNRG